MVLEVSIHGCLILCVLTGAYDRGDLLTSWPGEQGERQKQLGSQCDLQKSASDSPNSPINPHPFNVPSPPNSTIGWGAIPTIHESLEDRHSRSEHWHTLGSLFIQVLASLGLISYWHSSNRIFWKMRHPKELIEYQSNLHLEEIQHTSILLSRFEVTSELSPSTQARLYVLPFFCPQYSANQGHKGYGHS